MAKIGGTRGKEVRLDGHQSRDKTEGLDSISATEQRSAMAERFRIKQKDQDASAFMR